MAFNLIFFIYWYYLFIILGIFLWNKVSGSQRWIDLYFLVLQPSELMKIAVILCLAKYYHRINIEKVNSFNSILFALTIITIPIILVLSQPDLGTSVLIASSGLIILWLGGVKIKYFFLSFITF